MTRAPCDWAISIDPSVEPLSATTTSPVRPPSANARQALSMQMPSEFASFRQGITTETSGARPEVGVSVSAGLLQDCVWLTATSGAPLERLSNKEQFAPPDNLPDRSEIPLDDS